MTNNLKTTALYDRHVALNAKIVPFAGYAMPVQYQGIMQEHKAVRKAAGLFDVSHMGEFIVAGSEAEAFLQYVTANDIGNLHPGQAQYSVMCNETGGIIDDLLVYRFHNHFMLVVNAANVENDFEWLGRHLQNSVTLTNISDEISLVALQGPKSRDILQELTPLDLNQLPFYHLVEDTIGGKSITIARTGYTGELGYELYGHNEDMPEIWDRLYEVGQKDGLKPVGLGARDTLRLEMKYCLYGNDIDTTTNPIEAGLGWITKIDKGDFIGRQAIIEAKNDITRKLVCIEMIDRAVPRPGYNVFYGDEEIGKITSGNQSPSLQKGIGLAYLTKSYTRFGTEVEVEIRGRRKKALVVKPPFYKNGTVHK